MGRTGGDGSTAGNSLAILPSLFPSSEPYEALAGQAGSVVSVVPAIVELIEPIVFALVGSVEAIMGPVMRAVEPIVFALVRPF